MRLNTTRKIAPAISFLVLAIGSHGAPAQQDRQAAATIFMKEIAGASASPDIVQAAWRNLSNRFGASQNLRLESHAGNMPRTVGELGERVMELAVRPAATAPSATDFAAALRAKAFYINFNSRYLRP